MHRQAVFLDLNGTLVMPLKPEQLNDLVLIGGADLAVARLCRAGYLCPVVTVQSRIAKGLFTEVEFRHWFKNFAEQVHPRGAEFLGPYVCPHSYNEPCACRKPSSLLYKRAAQECGIDLRRSYVVGDTSADVEAAIRFGGRGCLVRTGWAEDEAEADRAARFAAYIADSLGEAVDWILSRPPENGI